MAVSPPRISGGGLALGLVLGKTLPDPQRLIHTEEPVDIWEPIPQQLGCEIGERVATPRTPSGKQKTRFF